MRTQAFGRSAVAGLALFAALTFGGGAFGAPSGKLVVLNWYAATELDRLHKLEAAFMKKHPSVQVVEVSVTASGDPRGSIRTALMGGEKVDILINAWPAFREELVATGFLRPLDEAWDSRRWGEMVADSWRAQGMVDGKTYAVPQSVGYRDGLWHRLDTFKKAGMEAPPETWAAFLDSFAKLRQAGMTPLVVPAKSWVHGNVFESLLLRTAGAETVRKLSRHEIPWTDPSVRIALLKWREMLEAGCCDDAATMLGTEWDHALDRVMKLGTGGFLPYGMLHNYLQDHYGLVADRDFSMFPFPALGLGHDAAAGYDAREFVVVASGSNPEAAAAFIDFYLSEGAEIYVKEGGSTVSRAVDPSLYMPLVRRSNALMETDDLAFVLGDVLPGELADEYRIQLQKFLQDPSDAAIDKVVKTLEAKARGLY